MSKYTERSSNIKTDWLDLNFLSQSKNPSLAHLALIKIFTHLPFNGENF